VLVSGWWRNILVRWNGNNLLNETYFCYLDDCINPVFLNSPWSLKIANTAASCLRILLFNHFRIIFNINSAKNLFFLFPLGRVKWKTKQVEDLKFKMKFYLNRKRQKNKIKGKNKRNWTSFYHRNSHRKTTTCDRQNWRPVSIVT
jgi:hypothetical protein